MIPADISKVELSFTPSTPAGFANDQIDIQLVYLSATTVAGITTRINQTAGTFEIGTGISGIGCSIGPGPFQPQIHTNGFIKAWASI